MLQLCISCFQAYLFFLPGKLIACISLEQHFNHQVIVRLMRGLVHIACVANSAQYVCEIVKWKVRAERVGESDQDV